MENKPGTGNEIEGEEVDQSLRDEMSLMNKEIEVLYEQTLVQGRIQDAIIGHGKEIVLKDQELYDIDLLA